MLQPPEARARANHREQAEVLAEDGVDLTALEMLRDVEQATYAVVEAATTPGLSVWAGFSCIRRDNGRSYSGTERTPSPKPWRRCSFHVYQ